MSKYVRTKEYVDEPKSKKSNDPYMLPSSVANSRDSVSHFPHVRFWED